METLKDGTVVKMTTPTEAYVQGAMSPALADEEALDYEVQWFCKHHQFEQAAQLIRGWVYHRRSTEGEQP